MTSEADSSGIIPNPPVRLPRSISSSNAGFKSAVATKIDDFIDIHQLSIPINNRYDHSFKQTIMITLSELILNN